MNTDNKNPEEAMPEKQPAEAMSEDKPVAASTPTAGESSAHVGQNTTPPIPAAPAVQTSATAESATVNATANVAESTTESAAGNAAQSAAVQAAAQDDGAAKAEMQAGNNKESAAQSADVKEAKTEDAKDNAEQAKAAKRGGGPRRVSGIVIGNKADKTARVRIERRVKHALYGKIIRRRTHLQAHDADNKCRIGDAVTLEESPRFSKTKSWRVISVTPGEGR